MTGHTWQLDEDGEVDMFAADIYDDAGTGHNGPQCTACGYTFCAYCPTDYKGRTGDDRWDSECTPRVAT